MTLSAIPIAERSAGASSQRPVTFTRSAPYFAALLVIALVAFWPTYLSRVSGASGYTHLHALTAATWMLMLVAQPLAIRTRRLPLHRLVGRTSYFVAPLVVVSMVLLAHSKTPRTESPEALGVYVPLSLAALFALSYGLAILTRRKVALHARFMVCTSLTLIDPVFVRLLLWAYPHPRWLHQWWTFALTDVAFLVLIWYERHARIGRMVFPVMLSVFVVAQVVLLFGLYQTPVWAAFVRWFLALPLT